MNTKQKTIAKVECSSDSIANYAIDEMIEKTQRYTGEYAWYKNSDSLLFYVGITRGVTAKCKVSIVDDDDPSLLKDYLCEFSNKLEENDEFYVIAERDFFDKPHVKFNDKKVVALCEIGYSTDSRTLLVNNKDEILAIVGHGKVGERNQYKYCRGFKHKTSDWDNVSDKDVDTSWLSEKSKKKFDEYRIQYDDATRDGKIKSLCALNCCQDFKRLDSYGDQWNFVGVKFEVESIDVNLDDNESLVMTGKISLHDSYSSSSYGIENDCSHEDICEIIYDVIHSSGIDNAKNKFKVV